MRRIIKGQEPEALHRWKQENVEVPQNLTYGNMPKAPVKSQMLLEQGYLCGYTMQRIQSVDDCHIEHIIPRSQNHLPQLDINYTNLLACVPSDTPGHRPQRKNFPYGAMKKGGAYIDCQTFVSPLQEDVEVRFRYLPDGRIDPAPNDDAATNTIEILALDHNELSDLRRAAIEERVLDADLSAEEADSLSRTIMTFDSSGRLAEFCLAISDVAVWYANMMRRSD